MSDSASSPTSDTQSPPPPDSPPPESSSTNSPPPDESSSSSDSPPPPPTSDDSSSSTTTPSGDSSVPTPTTPTSSSSSSSSGSSSSSSSSSGSSSSNALAPPTTPASNGSGSGTFDNIGVIIGVSVGVGVLLIIITAICITCCMKKKKRKKMQNHDNMHFYADPDGKHKTHYDSNYYPSSQQNWQGGNNTNPNMHPPPQGGKWPMPPPPPGMSSDMSSNYSGGPYNHASMPPPSPGLSLGFNSNFFTYEDLANATGGFAQENLLGQGGFGYVHKGVLPSGKVVAVKSLKSGSGQGEREFQAEVEIISRVHHRHLVSLVGYCMAGPQRMLVYEFVPNGTMEYHLHGRGRPVMDWETRLRIALGSAKGLAYLHEDCHPRIIHRDIKAANILVDNNFEAMVADFGLAKLSSDNNTHVSTRVMGTFGYLAPEYASSGKLTEKSDVFSFGVMLLELITGRRPVDNSIVTEDSLVDWARPLISRALEDNNFNELVDARLEGNYNPQEMARMVACAGASIRHSGRKRPKMSQIVRALEGDMSLEALNDVPKTSTTSGSTTFSSNPQYDTAMYKADMERFREVALSSQEFSSESSASDARF